MSYQNAAHVTFQISPPFSKHWSALLFCRLLFWISRSNHRMYEASIQQIPNFSCGPTEPLLPHIRVFHSRSHPSISSRHPTIVYIYASGKDIRLVMREVSLRASVLFEKKPPRCRHVRTDGQKKGMKKEKKNIVKAQKHKTCDNKAKYFVNCHLLRPAFSHRYFLVRQFTNQKPIWQGCTDFQQLGTKGAILYDQDCVGWSVLLTILYIGFLSNMANNWALGSLLPHRVDFNQSYTQLTIDYRIPTEVRSRANDVISWRGTFHRTKRHKRRYSGWSSYVTNETVWTHLCVAK